MTLLLSRAPELIYEPEPLKLDAILATPQIDEAIRHLTRTELKAWYSRNYRGLGWHQIYKIGGNTYRSFGLDIVHGSRTSIPAIHTGTVEMSGYSSALGHFIVVKHNSARVYITYMHLVSGATKGAHVTKGQHIGYIAGYGDAHGSQWTGPHLALHRGKSLASWTGVNCSNPLTSINGI